MTTQTTVFDGLPTGLTLTGKAFDTDAPDTEVTGNTFGLVEGANAKGRYVVTITRATALPAGDYDIRLFVGSVPIAVGRFRFAGTDGETAVEVPEAVELDSATQAQLTSIEEDSAAAVGYLTTLVGRVTTGVYAMWLDLIAMITGSGTADAKFDAAALSLAPTGSGGGGLTEEQDETLTGIAVKLAGTPIEVVSRVADGGNIVAYVGDDFRVRSDSSLTITVSDPAGGLFTKLEAIGVENLAFGAMLDARNRIAGTVADLSQSGSGASQLLSVEVELSEAGTTCKVSDDYVWQIESTQEHDSEQDTLIEIEGTLSLRRNVVSLRTV